MSAQTKAADIMSAPVQTVRPETTVNEIAKLMSEKRISGVPVVGAEGELLGIVSETDLLHRPETRTERKRKWWARVFLDAETLARDFVKTHGLRADQIMSRYVISVPDSASLGQVADVLEVSRVKRVPVLKEGRLVGIISRGDLVRALAQAPGGARGTAAANDATLQKQIMKKIGDQPWISAAYITATATDGVVELWGIVGSEAQRQALTVLVQETPGVQGVKQNLRVGFGKLGQTVIA